MPTLTEDTLEISTGPADMGAPEPIPRPHEWIGTSTLVLGDPSGITPATRRDQGPWDDEPQRQGGRLTGAAILGPYDGWLGEVVQVNYASGDLVFGDTQPVMVKRVDNDYGTNNEPTLYDAPGVHSQPEPAMVEAHPWPLRHDQESYHVADGDAVTVFTGRDGRRWFLSDELPFMAWVIDSEASSATTNEDWAGGAGLLSLKVRRYALSGDPDGSTVEDGGATLADLETAAAANVDYQGVLVVGPTNQQHGYRVGDQVLVHRRGRYLFASPGASSFLAKIHNAGPGSQVDFTKEALRAGDTNDYWVVEQDETITYANDDEWSNSGADRTQAVAGMSGTNGRWVQAKNLGEPAASHRLAVDGTVLVNVHMYADPVSGEPHYWFNHSLGIGRVWMKAKQNYCNDSSSYGTSWYVKCYMMDEAGGSADTNTEFVAYINSMANLTPNIVTDQEFQAEYDAATGEYWVVSPGIFDGLINVSLELIHSTTARSGWQLCDGTNDAQGNAVPDIGKKFIWTYESGDGTVGAIGNTGGSESHTHTAHGNHTDGATKDCFVRDIVAGTEAITSISISAHTNNHSTTSHLPTYYVCALAIREDIHDNT